MIDRRTRIRGDDNAGGRQGMDWADAMGCDGPWPSDALTADITLPGSQTCPRQLLIQITLALHSGWERGS